MQDKGLVTIVIPCYNDEQYIETCILSACNQTYKNLEIIVVNDGSKDSSLKIINRLAKEDDRIIVLNKENGGLSSARNRALKIFKGDYIYFLDADDRIWPTSIEYLLGIMIDYNVDIVYSFTNKGNAFPMILESDIETKNHDEAILSYLLGENFSESCCAKLFKRYFFEKLKFEEGRIHEDTFITYQILAITNSIAITKFNGYISTVRDNSITHAKFGNKNYDKVIAGRNIYNYYKGSQYEELAYNKYIGILLYFILKTNKLKREVSYNEVAREDLKELIDENGFKQLKNQFIPLILLERIGLLKFISY